MKKTLVSIMLVVLTLCLIVSCSSSPSSRPKEAPVEEPKDDTIHVTSVSFSDDSLFFWKEDGGVSISYSILPNDATNKNVIWDSSASDVASVEDGNTTFLKAGITTITVKSAENEEIKDSCLLTIKEGVTISGTVKDADASPVSGAIVSFSYDGAPTTFETNTGADGSYALRIPEGISGAIMATYEGYTPGFVEGSYDLTYSDPVNFTIFAN